MSMNRSPVKPGSKRWKELVTAGIVKDADRNWFLGDAALEIAPIGDHGVNNGNEDNLRRYAHEIGVGYESLDAYRKVAAGWPEGTRVPSAPWKVHQMFLGRQDKLITATEGGDHITVTRAHEILGHSTAARQPLAERPERQPITREEISEAIKADPKAVTDALKADPEFAAAVAQDSDAARSVEQAFTERLESEWSIRPRLGQAEREQFVQFMDLHTDFKGVEYRLPKIIRRLRDLPLDQVQQAYLGRAQRIERMATAIRELLEGDPAFEAELDDLLGEPIADDKE